MLVVMLWLGATSATPALGCPNCGKSVAVQENGKSLEQGYRASILLLMAMPFVILAGLTALFSWEVRRAKLRVAEKLAASATIVPAGAGPESLTS